MVRITSCGLLFRGECNGYMGHFISLDGIDLKEHSSDLCEDGVNSGVH